MSVAGMQVPLPEAAVTPKVLLGCIDAPVIGFFRLPPRHCIIWVYLSCVHQHVISILTLPSLSISSIATC